MKHKNTTYVPVLMLVVYVLLALSRMLLGAVQDVSSNAFLSLAIVQFLVLLLPTAFYCGLNRRSFLKTVPFRLPALRDVPFILYVTLAFLFGEATLKYLVCVFFSESVAKTSSLITVSLYTSNTPLVILCFILLPAVLEQMLFSGLVLSEYRDYGDVISVAMSAVLFAMAHFSFENVGFFLFYGLCTALVTRVCSSVIPAILIGIASTAFDVYLEDMFFDYITQTGTSALLFYFFFALFLLFSVFAVSYLEKSYARRARSAKESARAALLAV
ncbi:MAG: hypothetical protein IKT43_04825, partial [Clostridia bacterium]|nr:hypothetical protein [Clostridia bacterium]